MATLEDTIKAYIGYLKKQGSIGMKPVDERYGVNTAFRRRCEIEIRTLQDTPHDINVIERLLERKT
jgi:hypothetical protein